MEDKTFQPDWQLVARHLAGESTPGEAEALRQWAAADPSRARWLQRIEADWQRMQPATNRGAAQTHVAWMRLRARLQHRRPVYQRPWARVAAVAAVLLAATSVWLWNRPAAEQPWTTLIASADQHLQARLPDGSQVNLHAGSELQYRFADQHRQLRLSGEAYFEVAADAKRPFEVAAQGLTVHVVGTGFLVQAYPDDSLQRVLVTHGRVRVQAGGTDRTVLSANRGTILQVASGRLSPWQPDTTEYLAWRSGQLRFRNTPLDEVARRLSRWYNVPVRLQSPELAACRLTATFDRHTLQQVLQLIQAANGMTATWQTDAYVLSGAPCATPPGAQP